MRLEIKVTIVTRGGQSIGQSITLCLALLLVSEVAKSIIGQSLNVNGGIILD